MQEPNDRFRAARERTPSARLQGECLSRRELAQAVNAWLFATTGRVYSLDAHYVARFERGAVRWPSADYRAALRHVLRAESDEALDFYPTPRGKARPGHAPRLPATAMTTIHAMAQALHVADRKAGGGGLYETTVRYLTAEIAPQLVNADPADSAALFAAAGGLSDIAGWMAHDAGQDDRARQHFDRAFRFAKAADHPALIGSVCASLSHLAGQYGRAADAERTAASGFTHAAHSEDNGCLLARLHAMSARAHAMRGDKASCRTALRESEQALDTAAGERSAEWTAPFDHGSLAAEAALCLRQLGSLNAAEQHARQALSLRGDEHVRSRAFNRITLARILVDAGRSTEAATIGQQVCTTIPILTSHRIRTRLARLAEAIEPCSTDPEVSAFLADYQTLNQ
jgi:tetratricopeptide (TPR) repeat protein